MRRGPKQRTARLDARGSKPVRVLAAGLAACIAALSLGLTTPTIAQQAPPLPNHPDPLKFIDPNLAAGGQKRSSFQTKGAFSGPVRKADKAAPLFLNADELEYDTRNNRVIARGSVEIYYNDNALTADQVIYDQSANTLTATGNARLKQPDGAVLYGERIDATADFVDAFVQSISIVGKDDSRIVARRAIRRDGTVTEFEKGKFTPCRSDPSKPPLWCVAAERMVHDQAKKTITYQDAQFELFGVPIAYFPFFQHPDPSVKSATGLLPINYSSTSQLGSIVEVPYHIAINPSMDFLFHPMYMSKYGILWLGDWRQSLRIGDAVGTYTVNLAGIDQTATPPNYSGKDLRGSIETHGRFSLSSWWKFGWDYVETSDNTFRSFYHLDGILQQDRVNDVFLHGMSQRNFFGVTFYQVGGLLTSNTSASQSQALPVIDYNYVVADPVLGGELSFKANALNFQQHVAYTDTGGVARAYDSSSSRVVAQADWRKRLTDPLGQVFTPFLSARGDIVSNNNTVNPYTGKFIDEQSTVRGVGAAGVLYSYPFAAYSGGATHVVEPVGQIIARQAKVDQRAYLNTDSRSVIHDDVNLFEVDKISGWDRIETGVRANYGLQYTLQANTGGSMRFLAGQSYHLTGDNIYRNPGVDAFGQPLYSPLNGLERNAADYVMGFYLSPNAPFRFVAQSRFDERNMALRRADIYGQTNYGPILADVGYSYLSAGSGLNPFNNTANLFDQQEITALLGLRVTDNWSVIGKTRYSIDQSRPIQNIVQLRYADECFVLTTSYIETHVTNYVTGARPDHTLMLRFEFKYLGEYVYKTNVLDQYMYDQPAKAPY